MSALGLLAKYGRLVWNTILGTADWTWRMIKFEGPWYENYFYGLILISIWVWVLEIYFPWRKNQPVFRKDFWLDGFYIFFNFFIFSIAISGLYELVEAISRYFGFEKSDLSLFNIQQLPIWLGLIIFFIMNDFVQWFTHVLLHRYKVLWRFHKVHHSVMVMGFAAHMRYHWMENILYKPLKTLVVMLIGGFEPQHAFIIHFVSVIIGHLNHANIRLTWGPLKYIFNNPVMHLYHHAKHLPQERPYGVNFGISLSLWDYIFRTNYVPQEQDGSYELGFEGVEQYPDNFMKQLVIGFRKRD